MQVVGVRNVVDVLPSDWKPTQSHGAAEGTWWMIAPDGCIWRDNKLGPRLTKWEEARFLARDVWQKYQQTIDLMTQVFPHVSPSTLIATACTESQGQVDKSKWEKHKNDYSLGICQLLTATAFRLGVNMGWPLAGHWTKHGHLHAMPRAPYPYGRLSGWRSFLFNPFVSFAFAAAYHTTNNGRFKLQGDPLLQYACYNAGGPYVSNDSHWRIHSAKWGPGVHALDGFELYHNDAAALIAAKEWVA